MENKMITLNASPLPVKTWRYLKINQSTIPVPEKISGGIKGYVKNSSANIEIFDTAREKALSIFDAKKAEGSLGVNVYRWFFDQTPEAKTFTVRADSVSEEPVHVKFSLEKDDCTALFVIHAEKNSSSRFIFETDSLPESSNICAVYLLCLIEENAELEIVQAQFMGKKASYIFDHAAVQAENSKLKIIRGNFGAAKSWLGIRTNLNGDNAEVKEQLAYMTDGEQYLDINDIACHHGKTSISSFNTQGVMLGKSWKNYKGTIDFIRGCAGSEGTEMEDVLLLSDAAVNKTTPTILCDEEDVSGNHGATLGKIDENLLFYMETRGISEEKAKQMVADGKLCKIVSLIPSQEIAEKALDCIDSAFGE